MPILKTCGRVVISAGVVALTLLTAAPALAHVDLVASDPVDGAVLGSAPSSIRLEFSTGASPVRDGAVLYDETGTPVAGRISSVSDTVVILTPDAEIPPGPYAVSWTMQAGDAHPRSGTVSFYVSAPGATDAPSVAPSLAPDEPAATTAAAWLGRLARAQSIVATLMGLGVFVFASLIAVGSRPEARRLGYWGRRAGAAIVVSVPLEIGAQAVLLSGSPWGAISPGSLADAMGGGMGIAMLLRAIGGTGLLLGTRLVTAVGQGRPQSHQPISDREPAAVTTLEVAMPRVRFRVAASPVAVGGAALVALSFLFDGHTAVTAPLWLVRFASVAHVTAAATWVGGVAILAALLSRRKRLGLDLDAAHLILPFSVVATAAVVIAGLGGSVLAIATADAISDFYVTPWGRALLAKLAFVAAAGAVGAYNHRKLVPLLRADQGDRAAATAISNTVRLEIVLLLGAALTTAVMVGLAS